MRKMLCEIALQKAQGYPGRYLEHYLQGKIVQQLTQNAVTRLRNLGRETSAGPRVEILEV